MTHLREWQWQRYQIAAKLEAGCTKKVDEMILMDYSPEQIVGVCRKQGIKMVSHETISVYLVGQGPRRRTVQASASSWSSAQEARSPEKEKGHNSEQNRHLRKTENR